MGAPGANSGHTRSSTRQGVLLTGPRLGAPPDAPSPRPARSRCRFAAALTWARARVRSCRLRRLGARAGAAARVLPGAHRARASPSRSTAAWPARRCAPRRAAGGRARRAPRRRPSPAGAHAVQAARDAAPTASTGTRSPPRTATRSRARSRSACAPPPARRPAIETGPLGRAGWVRILARIALYTTVLMLAASLLLPLLVKRPRGWPVPELHDDAPAGRAAGAPTRPRGGVATLAAPPQAAPRGGRADLDAVRARGPPPARRPRLGRGGGGRGGHRRRRGERRPRARPRADGRLPGRQRRGRRPRAGRRRAARHRRCCATAAPGSPPPPSSSRSAPSPPPATPGRRTRACRASSTTGCTSSPAPSGSAALARARVLWWPVVRFTRAPTRAAVAREVLAPFGRVAAGRVRARRGHRPGQPRHPARPTRRAVGHRLRPRARGQDRRRRGDRRRRAVHAAPHRGRRRVRATGTGACGAASRGSASP